MKNFFISYNKADKQWAEWIAWQLEDAGYTTVLQAWDFYAGSNFVIEMHRSTIEAERTIAVLSSNYLKSRFTQPEWATAFAQDPTGANGKLLPVRVEDCELDGLVLPIIYIDLVGKSEEEANSTLLEKVRRVRAKPTRAPGFPDNAKPSVAKPQHYPGHDFGSTIISRETLRRFSVLGLYLISLAALLWGILRLPAPLENLMDRPVPLLALSLAGIPLWATIGFDALPKFLRYWRKRHLIENGIRGKLVESSYFRIHPYQETEQDQKRYTRADKTHEDALAWIRKEDEKILYLTGRSGSGKSSLLNAFVIPKLREGSQPFFPLVLRSFHDPVHELHKTLLKPGLIWEEPPFAITDTRELLEKACQHIGSKRLLLIFDQFEELLIIYDRVPARLRAFRDLLSWIMQSNIPSLSALLVIRSDYLGKLQELELSPMRQNQNWKEISPFTEKAARDFIKNSGLKISEKLMDDLISQAAQLEETRGLIRPITLNMLGMIADRITYTRANGLGRRKGVGALLIEYLHASIGVSEAKDYSRQILRGMITPAGTKRPRLVADLSRETKINPHAITGCLLILSNYGLVRRIDEQDGVWEISHDFVARLLGHVLSNWRRAFVQRLRPWIAPVSLILWLGIVLFLMSTYFARREQQIRTAVLQRQGTVVDVPGGIRVSFPSDDKELGSTLESLVFLPNIQELDLSETKVTDSELAHVEKLTSIKVLNLNKTEISGEGLKHVSEMNGLQDLYLANTKINSGDLKHLSGLNLLRKLYLYSNQIDDSGLESLKALTGLQTLSLGQTRIQDEGLKHLTGLTNLQELYLGGTDLNDDGLRKLATLKNLRELFLQSTRITDVGISVLREFKSLQELSLSDTEISDAGLDNLRELTELRVLSLDKTQVGDSGFSHLRGLTNLRELNVSYTQVTGLGLDNLKDMSNLRELWAKHTKIADVGLENISGLESLEILSLPETEVSDQGLEKIRDLTNLRELYLGATKITGAGLRNLQGMSKLQLLYAPATDIADDGLRELIVLFSLQQLRITDTKVTRRGVEKLKRSLPNLKIES